MTGSVITLGGRPFLLAGKLALSAAATAAVPVDPPPAPGAAMPTAGQSGWWDASALSWGSAVYSLTDKSSAGKNLTTDAQLKAMPRQAGMLGGLHTDTFPDYSSLHPRITDYTLTAANVAVGAGQTLTVFLAWSRPNLKQSNKTPAVSLVKIDGTAVLDMAAAGDGNDVLSLFGAPIAAAKVPLRHTHSARLVFSGSTVDVWLDNVKVVTGAASQITLGSTAAIAFLSAAQCTFHEAAVWSKALSASEHADLSSYAQRWPLGARAAAIGLIIGQSNANNLFGGSLWPVLIRMVAYWTGTLSATLFWTNGQNGNIPAGKTVYPGQGLYNGTADPFLNSAAGGDPSTWPLGTNGEAFMAALDSLTAEQRASLRYVAWFWSETVCGMLTRPQKATHLGAMKHAIQLIRARAGHTAAELPIMLINPLPANPSDEGGQVYREVVADLVADPSQNCQFMLTQTDDAIGIGATYDTATGIETSGDPVHRHSTDMLRYMVRASAPIARAVVAANASAGTPDVVTAIDASVPVWSGPKIISAHAESGTSVLVTVQHDGGSDLAIPLRAAQGAGWFLNDRAIAATACARVSATQLRLTFPSVPAGALLYYAYGTGLDANNAAQIGRGNAVTDNFSTTTLAAGWRVGVDLAQPATYQPDQPLQATTYGIALT